MGKSRATSPVGLGASMAGDQLKNDLAVPNQHDVNAKLFKGLSGSFGAKPGDRPRGAWRNAASGFFAGLEHAENSKSTAKKNEKLEQYDKVMEYFQEVNNSAIEQNQWYEKREFARKQALPSVLAYMNNIDRLDPQSQFSMAQNILSQYSSAIGEPLKLVSIGGSNPNMVTVEGANGVSVLDLSTLVAGDDALEEQIAHKSVDYQLALQEKRDLKQKEFDRKENELKAKYPNYGKEGTGGEEDYGSIPLANIKKGGGGRAFMNTINAEMNLAKDIPVILSQLDEAEAIIKDHPELGSGWNNLISKGSFTKSLMRDSRPAFEKLEKISSRVEEAFIRAKGSSITDSERETIKKGLFQTTNVGESNKFNIDSVRKELAIAQERGEFAADELVNGRVATPQSFRKYQEAKKMQNEAVTVFDPATGEKQRIPANQLDAAVEGGWELQQ